MKKQIFLLAVACSFFTNICMAQKNAGLSNTPGWITDKGFWVVESNQNTPKKSTVYFYNTDKQLVYKEQIEGVSIRLNRKKVLMHLKAVLEKSVAAWETQQVVRENELLLATVLKK